MSKQDVRLDEQDGGLHQSVLLREALAFLNVRPGKTYVDATAGAGGHLQAIADALGLRSQPASTAKDNRAGLEKVTVPSIIGIDRDRQALDHLQGRLNRQMSGQPIMLVQSNFSEIRRVLDEAGLSTVSGGIFADLGVSSMQIDSAERGFSFLKDGPLDMRMDSAQDLTAWDIVNRWPEADLPISFINTAKNDIADRSLDI